VTAPQLLREVLRSHGGPERWHKSGELSVDVSAGGVAVASKLQPRGLYNLTAQVSTDCQRVVFSPYPSSGHRGVLDRGSVRIESDDGRVVRQRLDPRSRLGDLRHLLRWDHLDLLYFGASSLWTYIAVPFVFANRGFQIEELEPWPTGGELWRRLSVTFPLDLHTHSRRQIFYFGEDGLIRRQDYTAEEFGGWAKSANYCSGLHDFGGLVIPTRRRVFLRRANNMPRRHPVLVWIDIRNVGGSGPQD
jgi:hypothetical protein